MLTNIRIKNVASYGEDTQSLNELNVVNFIYGDNGSGKTTIAKLIGDSSLPDYHECQLEWQDDRPMKALVYNKDFVEKTLKETKVKGVFTFGDGASEKQEELNNKVKERESYQEKIDDLRKRIEGINTDITKETSIFREKCWEIKTKYSDDFYVAFQGTLKSKEEFKNRCMKYIDKKNSIDIDEIRKKSKVLFGDQPQKFLEFSLPNTEKIPALDTISIFKTKIIGKGDVPIAELINHLGNSDWVLQGMQYYSGTKCPFCQQETSSLLQQSFEQYFDDSFIKNIEILNSNIKYYCDSIEAILLSFEQLSLLENDYFKYETIKDKIISIRAIFEKNKEILYRKQKESSMLAEINPIYELICEVVVVIYKANEEISKFNKIVDNFSAERLKLIEEIWCFVGGEAKSLYTDYTNRVAPKNKQKKEMSDKLVTFDTKMKQAVLDILEIEKQVTSIAPSKECINNTLCAFGFNNFQIIEDENEGYYRIIREDGSLVKETLSEGERTFISFLYFYQLIRGSFSKEGITEPRIIVFDDPVSSLDSKILFIVSTLIRKLFNKKELDKLNIKQIFILTHNVYFHKEVSFVKTNRKNKDILSENNFSYWIIRKSNKKSVTIEYKHNPISTNYQLLWKEVKRCAENSDSSINICNTLRRILENYFLILGEIDLEELTDKFDGEEKIVCRSLTSWIHDGSHNVYDGIDIGAGYDFTEQYLKVFKDIFIKTNHQSHYEMMMSTK